MKGQMLSIDLVFSVIILLIIISALTVVLLQYASFEEQQSQNRDIEIKSQAALNSLLLTPGVPFNWEVNMT
jgi:hypothetical protein